MTATRPANMLHWRKSSYSGYEGDCVETAFTQTILVRDSKAPYSGTIALSTVAWGEFIKSLAVQKTRQGAWPM